MLVSFQNKYKLYTANTTKKEKKLLLKKSDSLICKIAGHSKNIEQLRNLRSETKENCLSRELEYSNKQIGIIFSKITIIMYFTISENGGE